MRSFRLALLLASGMLVIPLTLPAQNASDAKIAERERISAERERQAAEKEMEIARRQLAEAARRLEAAQRRLSEQPVKNVQRRVVVMEGRPRLGVVVRTTQNPATDAIGAQIQAVSPGSPAAAAGLRIDDIITTFNGEPLAHAGTRPGGDESLPASRLVELAGELKDGDRVKLDFRRAGRPMSATLIVHAPAGNRRMRIVTSNGGEEHEMELDEVHFPEMPDLPELPGMIMMRPPGRVFDIDLVPMGPDLAGYFGAEKGLLVVRAPEGNRLKLKAGDVILKINGREPAGPPEAVRLLRGPEATLRLDILRKKTRQTLELPQPPQPPKTPKAPKAPVTPRPAAPPRPPSP